jgi:hypothetical protein
MTAHPLPSYLEQSDAVRARFERLKQREPILTVSHLHKTYDRAGQTMTVVEDVSFTSDPQAAANPHSPASSLAWNPTAAAT